jgi:uncharacterized membrane protein
VTYFPGRLWQIDAIRGIAIVMMIIFHALFDITYFGHYTLVKPGEFWWYFARVTASIFLIIVGISLTLSHTRIKDNMTPGDIWKKYFLRGVKIFGMGLLITTLTWIFLSEGIIIFGILHCIGLSIILARPLITYRYMNLVLSAICIFLGIYLSQFTFDFNELLWLGFTPKNLYSFDYVPLLPWFGLITLGLFIGNTQFFHNHTKKILKKSNTPIYWSIRFLCYLGRKSLLIYLLHQPLLILLLLGLGIIQIKRLGLF